ncbi:hypothetical protein CLM82_30480 [Streptomyces albidoflavus]|nr:hypothetical protein CLM82_30480 [Streptomyces albidoflavus]
MLSLLKLNVGADVELSGVELDIKGVDAQALLNVRLDNVAALIGPPRPRPPPRPARPTPSSPTSTRWSASPA